MSIHVVSTLHFKDPKYGHSPRSVAWFTELSEATQCVVKNWGDIFETSYTYAVIETLAEGLYPKVEAEHWFEWIGDREKGGYQACEKPERMDGVTGVAIG